MVRSIKVALFAATGALAALPLSLVQPANAQVGVYIGTPAPEQAQVPPRNGAWGDRDRDGIPNAFDSRNDNRHGRGDQDHDGVPNRYDRDRDGDGVPNQWDRSPSNPNRR
jgi:hypothetical protein